jgi:hypothetical protein
MKLSIFLIAFFFATLAVEAQCQIINSTVNQEDDCKKRQRMLAKRIMQQQRMQRQQMQFMYHQR